MEKNGFTIDIDVARRLLRIKMSGFWTVETAQEFAMAEQAAARTIARRPGEHLVLADLADFNLQSQVVLGLCKNLITQAALPSHRLAIVAGDGLARIQIKKIMLRDHMEVFTDKSEAEHWLLSGERLARAS